MADLELMTMAEAEIYLKVLEQDMRAAKQKLLKLEFQLPGLSAAQKLTLSAVVRESMLEIARTRLPAKLREQIPPALANRADELFKLWSPEDQ